MYACYYNLFLRSNFIIKMLSKMSQANDCAAFADAQIRRLRDSKGLMAAGEAYRAIAALTQAAAAGSQRATPARLARFRQLHKNRKHRRDQPGVAKGSGESDEEYKARSK
jgi:hypothetical protein